VLDEEAAAVPPGSAGLIFLPYLSGERTPHADPNARGVFLGLSLAHGRGHMARSIMEGVTFALADSVEIMRELGIEVGAVRSTGGGAASAVWRQIQADVLRARVATARGETGPAFGAAIIAGAGVGVFSSIPDATRRLVEIQSETEPDEARAALYRRHYEFYDSLYPALKGKFAELARLIPEDAPSEAS
jgi:xylulokinase